MTETANSVPQKKTPWYLGRAAVILGLMAVGPLALPFLWLSPDFKKPAKIAILVITVVLTAVSYILLNHLTQRLVQLQSGAGV